jgi:tetratricopeptide (TPR) repeat protein
VALNKKQTSTFTKVFIGLVVAMLVIALAGPSLGGWLGLFDGDQGQANGTEGDAALEQIAAKYAPTAQGYTQALASDPASYTALVVLGNTYSDWAGEVSQVSPASGADLPILAAAIGYYERALAIDASEPGVGIDLAIAYYYSGDASRAVEAAESVIAADDTFVPAYFNIAIFYDTVGDRDAAVAAAERYKELDPDGQFGDPSIADQIIAGGLQQ